MYNNSNSEDPFIKDDSEDQFGGNDQQNIDGINDYIPARLDQTHSLKQMEDEPAFMRRNVKLDRTVNPTGETRFSNWSVSEDKPFFNKDNSFFFDSVD